MKKIDRMISFVRTGSLAALLAASGCTWLSETKEPQGATDELAPAVWRGELNVRDFGAKGDGIHDDTAAIAAAIKAAQKHDTERRSPNGTMGENDGPHQSVVFPAGTYRVTETLITGRDAILRGLPGATVVMARSDADIFYFFKGARVRVEGLTFKGGRHQLNLATLNHENANMIVRNCTFVHAASNGICSVSRLTKETSGGQFGGTREVGKQPINEFMPDAQGVFRRDARFDRAAGFNNSTFFLIEDCFFNRCAHAIELHSDGSVIRNCRMIHPATSPGGVIIAPALRASSSAEVHYYGLDVLVERSGRNDQCFFDLQSGSHTIAIDDSTFRTDDGSGIPLFESRSISPYFFSSYFVRNTRVNCGGADDGCIIRLHKGCAPQILVFDGVRDLSGKPVRAIATEGTVDEAWLRAALDRFDSKSVTMDKRYTYTFGNCSANIQTDLGPYLNQFVKPFPDDLPRELFPRERVRTYAGKVIEALDFGVKANGRDDDSEALQRFADALAASPDAIGVLPAEWLRVSRPIVLRGRCALIGAGTTAFIHKDNTTGFFRVANGAQVKLRNLVFQNGKHVVEYAEDAAESTTIQVENCFAFNTVRWDQFEGAMFELHAKSHPERVHFTVTGGSYYSSLLYRGNARAFFDGFWWRNFPLSNDKEALWSTSVINEKGGIMRAADLLGVPMGLWLRGWPARNDPKEAARDFRWFDNYGTLHLEHVRFGGEFGGLVPVYAFGPAKTYMYGHFGEFKTFCCRQTPIYSDSPAAESRIFSVLSISRPYIPEQAKRIRFDNAIWLRQ